MFYQEPYNHISKYTKNLKPLIGSTVQCNFGGPEKGKGTLLKIGLDYCVLQCDEQVYYYPLHHIKGYTLIQKDDHSKEEDNGNKNNGNNKNLKCPIVVPGIRFLDVVDRLKGQKVQFNKGPSKIKGTVVGRDANHIILEVNDEMLYVSIFHIQNMCWDYYQSNNNQQSHDDSKDETNNDNNKNSVQNSSSINKQENNKQENNKQENNKQENNKQENNSQRNSSMDQWWRWYDSLWYNS